MSRLLRCISVMGVFVTAGTCYAGRLYISDSDTNSSAGINPTFTLNNVGASESLYVWAQLGSGETIPGLAYDVVNATSGVASGTAHVVGNPTILGSSRWNAINSGTLGGMVTGSNFVKVGGGLNGDLTTFDPFYDAATSSYRVSRIDFTGTSVGSTDVFLAVGSAGIALGGPGNPLFMGWGDASIPNNNFGGTSSLADATINVVPEPSGFVLLLSMSIVVVAAGRKTFVR